jgi:hypothetical protein
MVAIEQDNYQMEESVSDITQTINLGSYSNALLLVMISMNNNQDEITENVKWNGVNLTFKGRTTQDNDSQIEIFYMTNPAVGNYNLVANFDSELNRNASVCYVVLSGVDQSTPLGNYAGVAEPSGSGSPVTVNIPSAVGDTVFCAVASEDESSLGELGGQTVIYEDYQDAGNILAAGASYKTGEATQTSVGYTLSDDDHRALAGVAVKPAAAAGGIEVLRRRRESIGVGL